MHTDLVIRPTPVVVSTDWSSRVVLILDHEVLYASISYLVQFTLSTNGSKYSIQDRISMNE